MLDTMSSPSDGMNLSQRPADATSCSVTVCPGRSVCATGTSGTVTVCVFPSNVTGIGVTTLPHHKPDGVTLHSASSAPAHALSEGAA